MNGGGSVLRQDKTRQDETRRPGLFSRRPSTCLPLCIGTPKTFSHEGLPALAQTGSRWRTFKACKRETEVGGPGCLPACLPAFSQTVGPSPCFLPSFHPSEGLPVLAQTNPPVGGGVSMDRSVMAALPRTTPRLVRKSSSDGLAWQHCIRVLHIREETAPAFPRAAELFPLHGLIRPPENRASR